MRVETRDGEAMTKTSVYCDDCGTQLEIRTVSRQHAMGPRHCARIAEKLIWKDDLRGDH